MAIFPYLGLSLIPEPFSQAPTSLEPVAGVNGVPKPGEAPRWGRWSWGFCCSGLKKAESLRLSLYKDVVTCFTWPPLCGVGACASAHSAGLTAVSSPGGSCSCSGSVTALVPCPGEQQERSHCLRAELAPAASGVFLGHVPGQQGCVPGPARLSLLPEDMAAGAIQADLAPPSLGKGRGSHVFQKLQSCCSHLPAQPVPSGLGTSAVHHLALWILPWVLPCYSQSSY